MIYYSIPFSSDKNLGGAYNRFMELLKDDDYGVLLDGDAMFLHPFWGKQIEDITKKYPNVGIFCVRTNRLGCRWARYGDWESNDIAVHRAIAADLYNHQYSNVTNVSNAPGGYLLGGVCMVVKKSVWKQLGGFMNGLLGVDNDFHRRAMRKKQRIYLMNGVYVYHWYRGGDPSDKKHLL